jgi:hypothetical protein
LLFYGSGIAWFWLFYCYCDCSVLPSYCLSCYGSLLLSYRSVAYRIPWLLYSLTCLSCYCMVPRNETPREYVFILSNERTNGRAGGLET